ncbi:hypothetical protein QTO34_018740 [Cnephaeus nilssonii]|uniref:c-Myc-binding protein n=1 Tax=Cnephaeus nilssonii TaxID=3371016 RepID=A0AA40I071_CNENI|nr:hypothetical protein QTO34_018740 [Eptesicus nilssonii]
MCSTAPSPPATVSGASYAAAAVTMAHYKAADSKREQFRRYLEKSGVLDTLTKGEYGRGEGAACSRRAPRAAPLTVCDVGKEGYRWDPCGVQRGAATPENPEIELLRLELAEMKEKYEAIVEENKKLKAKLAQYEPPQEEKRAE